MIGSLLDTDTISNSKLISDIQGVNFDLKEGNSLPMVLHKCLLLDTCIRSKSNRVSLPEKQTKFEGIWIIPVSKRNPGLTMLNHISKQDINFKLQVIV